ncbi:MAG: histidine kinase N-terminal 7TM domain-containing protein [Haloarculaceae archaeon]
MSIALTTYTVPLFVAALVCLGLLAMMVPQRNRTGARPIIGFLSAVVLWTLSQAMLLGSSAPDSRLFWHAVHFVGPTLATLSIFVFALQYSGRAHLVTRRKVLALSVVPVLTNLLAWTNPFGLLLAGVSVVAPPGSVVRLEFAWGPWYYVHLLYTYALAIAAMALFVEKWLRLGESAESLKQSRTLVAATIAPLLGNLLYLLGVTQIDLAPIGFAVSAVLLLVALVFYS